MAKAFRLLVLMSNGQTSLGMDFPEIDSHLFDGDKIKVKMADNAEEEFVFEWSDDKHGFIFKSCDDRYEWKMDSETIESFICITRKNGCIENNPNLIK